jgi:hypothetical protein
LTAKGDSQRLFDRVEVRFPGRLSKKDIAEDRDIVIKDFSPEGIKILTTQRLSLFDRLTVSFTSHRLTPLSMDGHVVWVGQESPEAWHAGIKFDKVDLLQANDISELQS